MENMTFLFLGIIITYLVISFIKSRMVKENEREEESCKKENAGNFLEKDSKKEKEIAAIAAVIAAIMGDVPYITKRVYAKATVDEKTSNWRTAGRTELMIKKNLLT